MPKQVKGSLFKDYVRMVRKGKEINWSKYLTPFDLELVTKPIQPAAWYPLESLARLGAAVFQELARRDLRVVRSYGRATMEDLAQFYGDKLMIGGDPLGTLKKLKTVCRELFDFEAFDYDHSEQAVFVIVEPAFGEIEAEAYSHLILGGLERLLELTGASAVRAEFVNRAWAGDGKTVIEVAWSKAEPPREPAPATPVRPAPEIKPVAKKPAAAPGPRARRVMVIDDDDRTCQMAELILKRSGYAVTTRQKAMGSSVAIKEFKPDLIVLDVMMPGISGDSLAELIEARIKPRPLILLYSNKSVAELRELVKKLGVEGFVCKIDGPSALLAAVNAALKSGRS